MNTKQPILAAETRHFPGSMLWRFRNALLESDRGRFLSRHQHRFCAPALVVVLGLVLSGQAGVVTDTFTSSGAITFPAGVTNVKVEVWGSGGGGGSATKTNITCFGGGGGGGAYARLDAFVVTAGSNYVYTVGTAGTANGGSGNPTYFIDSSVLNANGGAGGGNAIDNIAPGGAGGAVGTTGDAQFAGGDGGTVVGNPTTGAQGGSSAGSAANGNNGSYNAGAGVETTAVTDGGPGGAASTSNGSAPSVGPGGGGGGARRAGGAGSFNGGAGAAGRIRFTYTVPDLPGTNTTTTVASSLNPSYFGVPVTFTATISPLSGSDTPTGTVQFKTNAVALGLPVTVTAGAGSNGVASITTSDLPAGTHTVTADYVATGPFNNSSGTLAGGHTVTTVTQFVWNNLGSAEWNTASNWTPAGPPVSSIALIDNGGTANVTANALYPVNTLRVGYGAGNSGTLTVGADLTVLATANSFIGFDGTGTLNVTNGTLRFLGTSLVRFGVNSGGAGSLVQSGGTVAARPAVHLGVNANGSYTLTGGSMLASNNLVAGINAGSVGTVTQSGGSITVGSGVVANSGQTWIGQSSVGVFNLSGGTFTATSMYLGSGAGGSGTVDQTGGTIDLVNGPAGVGVMTVGTGGTGTYSISNGVFSGNNLAVTNGTVNIKPGSTFTLAGALSLGAPAVVNFTFGAAGVSGITAGGTAAVDASATINVDGSAYTGGPGTFTLIDAASFDGTPVVTLTNFALAASHAWNTNTGNFTVTVGAALPAPTLSYAGGVLSWPASYLGWYAQSNSVSLVNTNFWFDIAGSQLVTNLTLQPSASLTNVFYRLRSP